MSGIPLVSAIINFFNEERFLREAIESVFSQTHTNWELLLVDDGSNDASSNIARHYSEQHLGRVFYLEHEGHGNRGTSASRNLGIRHAKGDYIAFLDADDVWLPEKLERQLAIMQEQPEASMVYGSLLLWFGWTGESEDIQRDVLQAITVEPDTLVRPPGLFTLFLERKAITPCPSDVILRRDLVTGVDGFVDSFRGLYDDQVFFAKVTLRAPVFVSGECWTKHRQHANSCCAVARKTGEYYSARPHLAYLDWVKKYLRSQGIRNADIDRALKTRLRRYRPPIALRWFRRFRHIAAGVWRVFRPHSALKSE